MMHNHITRAILVFLALALFVGVPCMGQNSELESYLKEGQESNPLVLAAKARVEQAMLAHEELAEFFDPDFFAALGRAEKARSIPGGSDFTSITNDSTDFQVGVEVPVNPGIYVSMGGARRQLNDPDGYDDLYQNMYGMRVRIPLLRDRAFNSLTLDKALAMAEYNARVSALLDVNQTLRNDIELAYINAYEKLSAYAVAQEATQRFKNLYEEAMELSQMKVVPVYQIHSSKLELQIGREDEEKARIAFELALNNLADAVGVKRKLALAGTQQALLDTAKNVRSLDMVSLENACMSRGAYLELKNSIRYAQVQIDKAEEETRDQLDVEFGISAQGEDEHNPFGMNEIITDRRWGKEAILVWNRKIDYRGPKARMAKYRARVRELNENLRQKELDIRTAMLDAELNFKGALARLEIVNQGIEAAKNSLAAEQERFRLGEGTSSDVTDAQKNLTTILQRQTTATADMLRARANYMFATGYGRFAENAEGNEKP